MTIIILRCKNKIHKNITFYWKTQLRKYVVPVIEDNADSFEVQGRLGQRVSMRGGRGAREHERERVGEELREKIAE